MRIVLPDRSAPDATFPRRDMALQIDTAGRSTGDGDSWYARSPERVAADLRVDPVAGLTAARAGELLTANGPNALPEEKVKPGWLRFLAEYHSYMQIILIAAAVVSLLTTSSFDSKQMN